MQLMNADVIASVRAPATSDLRGVLEESGAVEAEYMLFDTMEEPQRLSRVVDSDEQLISILDSVLRDLMGS